MYRLFAGFCGKIELIILLMHFLWRLFYQRIGVLAVFLIVVSCFFFFGATEVLAQTSDLDVAANAAGLENSNLLQTIGILINIFLGLLGVIFLIILLYAGFLWMTAGGSAEQVEKAKKFMINAVIGLIIMLAAYAITQFIMGALQRSFNAGGSGSGGGVSVEQFSGSLGFGVIRDHYPTRFATNVPRNTKIFVTFKREMDIASFVDGYDTNGTPLDTSDDVVTSGLNADNVLIYRTSDGVSEALSSDQVEVSFTEDLKTFVFNPPVLGSSTEDTNYTVFLSDSIMDAQGARPLNAGGYRWTFTVGTELDITPPRVQSVIPRAGGLYDRNIIVEITFSEAVDPTSATGLTSNGFQNINVSAGGTVNGEYVISNGYSTVTFITNDVCGTNSCGEELRCLPGGVNHQVTVFAATMGSNPPQALAFPYDGIVDVTGNSLDGNGDGLGGDDFTWEFTTTNNINFSTPQIQAITPDLGGENVDLDQEVEVVFGCSGGASCNSVLMSSTVNSDTLTLRSEPEHELWYKIRSTNLDEDNTVIGLNADPVKTRVTIPHGVFLESSESQAYSYRVGATGAIKNQYQNCFVPVVGPGEAGGLCEGTVAQPYCCNGVPSATACSM